MRLPNHLTKNTAAFIGGLSLVAATLGGCSSEPPWPEMGYYNPPPQTYPYYQYDPAPAVADTAPAAPSTPVPPAHSSPSWGTALQMAGAGAVGGHLATKALSSAKPSVAIGAAASETATGIGEGGAALGADVGEGTALAAPVAEAETLGEGLLLFLEDGGWLLLLE